MTAELQPRAPSEQERVLTWRLRVLLESGYDLETAEKIAHSDADLHRAVKLLNAGCPADTAAAILL